MLVQCPKCKTTYKVSDEAIKGPSAAFRCSRCKHTFELEPNAEPPANGPSAPDVPDELAFRFDAPAAKPDPQEKAAGADAQPAPTKAEPAPSAPASVATKDQAAPLKEAAIDAPGATSATTAAGASTSTPPAEPAMAAPGIQPHTAPTREIDEDSLDNIRAIEPYRDQSVSVTPFLTLLALLVVCFGIFLAYHRTNPAQSEGFIRNIPVVGAFVVRNDHLHDGVLLKSLQVGNQTLQGNREVLVLTGIAINQNPVLIRNVQVAGTLYDGDGKEVEQQTMWIGNAISPQIIRGMTAQDIIDLQRLRPLKSFEIPPGDSVSFSVVFLRNHKVVAGVRCQVVSADGAV